MRVSSTRIGAFLGCPRKFVFSELKPIDLESEAIDFGSLFHACMEAYWKTCSRVGPLGSEELWDYVAELPPGDYGGVDHLLEDEELVAWADRVFWQVKDTQEFSRLHCRFKVLAVEEDVTPWGVEFGEVQARGRVDLLCQCKDTGQVVLIDWKTRKDLSYAPFTDKQFKENPQFAYYAAIAHRYEGLDTSEGLFVYHGNVLRDSGRFVMYGTHFSPRYLEKMANYFDRHLVPEMVVQYERGRTLGIEYVERDDTHCFKYGKCAYYDECPAYKLEGDSFLDIFYRAREGEEMEINSPQAPSEAEPIAVPDKPINVLDSVTDHRATKLQGAGYFVLQDIMDAPDLTKISGFGPKTADKIVAEVMNYYEEYVEC